MPMFRDENNSGDQEDTFFDDVSRMADRLKLDGEKRENYIDDHMLEGGYRRVQTRESYARIPDADDEDAQGQGSRWGFGSRQQGGRAGGGGRSGGSSSRPANDQDRY